MDGDVLLSQDYDVDYDRHSDRLPVPKNYNEWVRQGKLLPCLIILYGSLYKKSAKQKFSFKQTPDCQNAPFH